MRESRPQMPTRRLKFKSARLPLESNSWASGGQLGEKASSVISSFFYSLFLNQFGKRAYSSKNASSLQTSPSKNLATHCPSANRNIRLPLWISPKSLSIRIGFVSPPIIIRSERIWNSQWNSKSLSPMNKVRDAPRWLPCSSVFSIWAEYDLPQSFESKVLTDPSDWSSVTEPFEWTVAFNLKASESEVLIDTVARKRAKGKRSAALWI